MKWANIMRIAIDNITGSLSASFVFYATMLRCDFSNRRQWVERLEIIVIVSISILTFKYENIKRKNSIDADGNLISVSMVYELLKV